MPLQNRVDPFGEIVSHPARGAMMGNRGRLHDGARALGRRRWTTRSWICCRLSFRGRRREIMAPRSYTELFFLDEATALAAGHRPCYECRRADFEAFAAAWSRVAGRDAGSEMPRAAEIDRALHAHRIGADRGKLLFRAPLSTLPDGAFVLLPGNPDTPRLVWNGVLLRWSFAGYDDPIVRPVEDVAVLTPLPAVDALRAGYRPAVHPTAETRIRSSGLRAFPAAP